MLKKILLPGTDLEISQMCLGTQYFGTNVPADTAFDLMDRFMEAGGNTMDTALIYSDWLSDEKGLSEKTIGKWIRARGNRNQVVISTKGAHPRFDDPAPRLDAASVRSDLEQSLRNLQMETVDLYWLHRDDENRPVEEILTTLETFRKEGKLRYYGCSNWRPARVREAVEVAKRMGARGFCANQMMWNLGVVGKMADPTTVRIDRGSYDLHCDLNMPLFAFSSQAGGYFALREKLGDAYAGPGRMLYENGRTERIWQICEELKIKYETRAAVIALSYLISQRDFPVFPLIGSDSSAILEESLAAADVILDEADVRRINEINVG